MAGFGFHVKSNHPAVYKALGNKTVAGTEKYWYYSSPENRAKRLHAAAQQIRFIEEVNKASDFDLARVPINEITDVTRAQVKAFIGAVKKLPGLRTKLYMEAIERSGDGYKTPAAYKSALRTIELVIEEATIAQKPTVVQKQVSFDPRVALEIVKLTHALGKGYSFTLHLLCLYGLRAITDGLVRDGINPPRDVPHVPLATAVLDADEIRARQLARFVREADDPDVASYGWPDDLSPEALLVLDEDAGEEPHDHYIHAEIERLAAKER
jgi:hypothetical protein